MSDVPHETVSLAAEVEVLRLVVVELVRRLPHEDRSAIEALVQRLATVAEDLSTLPISGEIRQEWQQKKTTLRRNSRICATGCVPTPTMVPVTPTRPKNSSGGWKGSLPISTSCWPGNFRDPEPRATCHAGAFWDAVHSQSDLGALGRTFGSKGPGFEHKNACLTPE